MSRTVIEEASDIIYGDREETYGRPSINLERISEQWSLYLKQKHRVSIVLSCEDVCWMMVDLKKSRQINTYKRDNLVDAIGYIALIDRINDEK